MQCSRLMQFRKMMQPGISVKSFKFTLALAFLTIFGACFFANLQMPATARTGHTAKSSTRYSDGVVVRKNADGTVETFDAGSAPQSLNSDSDQVARRPVVSHAYSRVIGGVHVRRNSDGTVETYEAPSRPVNLYPTVKQSKSHRTSK
jgi:hypothetical protein